MPIIEFVTALADLHPIVLGLVASIAWGCYLGSGRATRPKSSYK